MAATSPSPSLPPANAATPTAPDAKAKYFGKKIPPKCALRGCYLTDDSVHFYCTKMECQKHRSRRTKHSRYGRYDHLNPDHATLGARKTPLPPIGSPALPILQPTAAADCIGCPASAAAAPPTPPTRDPMPARLA